MNSEALFNYISQKPAYQVLLSIAEEESEFVKSIVELAQSDEFVEAINLISKYSPYAKNILEIGSMNELTGINLAIHGYNTTVVQPIQVFNDSSVSLVSQLDLDGRITIINNISHLQDNSAELFDIIYVRQRMHQADDLGRFINACVKQLKPDGVIISMRDDIVIDNMSTSTNPQESVFRKDVTTINNYSSDQYKQAMLKAGLHVLEEMKYFNLNGGKSRVISDGKFLSRTLTVLIDIWAKLISIVRPDKSRKPSKVYSYVSGRQIQSVLLLVGVKTMNLIKNLGYYD